MPAKPIYGLILAGGESRRMGQDKALLLRDGKSQLAHIAALLEDVTDRVFVSTRSEQQGEVERSRFAQIVDRYKDIGPIAGILSAMDEYPEVDWLIVACDLPNIDTANASLSAGQSIRKATVHSVQEQPRWLARAAVRALPEWQRCDHQAVRRQRYFGLPTQDPDSIGYSSDRAAEPCRARQH